MGDSGTDTGTETDTGVRIRKRATNAALQAKLESLVALGSAGDKGGPAEKEAFVCNHAENEGLVWLASAAQAASQSFGQPESWARAHSSLRREPCHHELAAPSWPSLRHVALDRCARSCLWT